MDRANRWWSGPVPQYCSRAAVRPVPSPPPYAAGRLPRRLPLSRSGGVPPPRDSDMPMPMPMHHPHSRRLMSGRQVPLPGAGGAASAPQAGTGSRSLPGTSVQTQPTRRFGLCLVERVHRSGGEVHLRRRVTESVRSVRSLAKCSWRRLTRPVAPLPVDVPPAGYCGGCRRRCATRLPVCYRAPGYPAARPRSSHGSPARWERYS